MKSVGVFEAKTHLSEILEQVEKGESVTITKRGEAVAQIIPIASARKGKKSPNEIVAGFQALQKQVKARFPSRDDMSVQQMIEEGRR
jgi:prevent-host-death family protein